MKVLKGFGLGILGFLLYLALPLFGLAFALNSTLLNPDFVVSELGRLDTSAVIKEVLAPQIPPAVRFLTPVIDDTLAELKPWIDQQVRTVVYSGYDYLLGKSQDLKVTITLEPAKEVVKKNLMKVLSQSLPSELQQVPPAMREQLISQIEQQFSAQLPSTFTLDKKMLGPDGESMLQQVRQGISYFQASYNWLIAFILILIAGIILIHRQVRGATRELGIIFLTIGALGYVSLLIGNNLILPQLAQAGLPASLQAWLPQVMNDLLSPMQTFNLVITGIGLVLLIVSFVYRRSQPAASVNQTM